MRTRRVTGGAVRRRDDRRRHPARQGVRVRPGLRPMARRGRHPDGPARHRLPRHVHPRRAEGGHRRARGHGQGPGGGARVGTATGLATEASYAPALGGFGPMVHEELAVFIDLERGIRVRHGIRQYTHVAPARTVRTSAEARRYLARAGFPHHGVVARTADGVQKGIQDAAVIDALLRRGPVELEPDLRAHMNPTRRRVLRRLSWLLAARLTQLCRGAGVRASERWAWCAVSRAQRAATRPRRCVSTSTAAPPATSSASARGPSGRPTRRRVTPAIRSGCREAGGRGKGCSAVVSPSQPTVTRRPQPRRDPPSRASPVEAGRVIYGRRRGEKTPEVRFGRASWRLLTDRHRGG